jgi:hypothetical protein
VTYVARDPAVLGLGFAATRDVVSFLRRSTDSANPLATGGSFVQRAIGFGVSQSGRYLRDFLYLGFNEDLAGGMVFDGLMPQWPAAVAWRPTLASVCLGATRGIRRIRPGRRTCFRSPTRPFTTR